MFLNLIFFPLSQIQMLQRTFRSDYFKIKNLTYDYDVDLKFFSYDKLTASFYHNHIDYINTFKEQCIPFELFKDISPNTEKFDILLLLNNQYIIAEYQKLTIEEKNILIENEKINKLFNEFQSILNIKEF